MKTLKITAFIILSFLSYSVKSQTIDSLGNYHAIIKTVNDSITGKTYTNSKGVVYPVYQGARGGVYYWVKAKKGNYYKKYLKLN